MDKSTLNRKLGKRIIVVRTEKQWSQADLARACGKDRQAIEKIENGKVNSTLYMIYEVAAALEVTLSELLDF